MGYEYCVPEQWYSVSTQLLKSQLEPEGVQVFNCAPGKQLPEGVAVLVEGVVAIPTELNAGGLPNMPAATRLRR